jgi:hypothetical protein
VLGLVQRQGLGLVLLGLLLGMSGALALTRLMASLSRELRLIRQCLCSSLHCWRSSPCWPVGFRRGGRRKWIR